MLKQSLLLLLISGIVALSAHSYEGYKIYDINARNYFEKQLLLRLSNKADYDFFDMPRSLGALTRVMVQPKDQSGFEELLQRFAVQFKVLDANLGKTLQQEQLKQRSQRLMTQRDLNRIDFTDFYRYAEINEYLEMLAKTYPSRVTVQTAGQSTEKRDIKTITITNGDGKSGKKVIFLDAGIHAREWIAPAGALFVIYQLVENFAANAELLKSYDWVILPLVNPDGYEYTHTKSRMWRKTRRQVSSSCYGTDGNRNFDFHWGEVGASNFSCTDTFMGTSAFSEPETQIVRDLLLGLTGRGKFYLTLHAYGNYLLYPWGWTSDLPSDWRAHHEVAKAGADAIRSSTGTKYTVGSSTNVLYAAAGGSDDYAYGVAKFPVAITMELPPGGSGFNPSEYQIRPFVTETWTGIRAMAQKIIEKY